jgi:hypothetical protein
MSSSARGAAPRDLVRESFLIEQRAEGLELARSSDLLHLQPIGGPATDKYIATFSCDGLVRTGDGKIEIANRFGIGIYFPPDYLRHANVFEVLTWLGPRSIWHPNVHPRTPHICIGWLKPGTSLRDILYQCFEIITYNKYRTVEIDALNHDACAWARRNRSRFPVDRRPLKRPANSPTAEAPPPTAGAAPETERRERP